MSGNQSNTTTEEETSDAATEANRETVGIVAESPLVEVLTPGAKVKILLALIRLRGEKLNPSGICERAKISYDTWYDHRDDLLAYGVIEEAGNAGNSPLYRVDMDDEIVQRVSEILDIAAERRNHAMAPDGE
jgi:hypothetical protein